MTNPLSVHSRRTVIFSGIGGLAAGGWWATVFAWFAKVRAPIVEVIGRGESQLVLLDTGPSRLLVIIGTETDGVLENFPRLMGLFRQRIDVLLISESMLAAMSPKMRQRWTFDSVLALPARETGLPPRSDASIRDPIELSLSAAVQLRCIPHYRDAWFGFDAPQSWRIEIERFGHVIAVAPSIDELASVPSGPFALAIAPSGSIQLASRKTVASSLALNAREIDNQEDEAIEGMTLTRIFNEDVARFEMHQEGIRLPQWAKRVTSEEA